MCVYLYIHNKYTQYTHIYYVNKNLFWMRLIAINRLTALIISQFYSLYCIFDQINTALVSRRDFNSSKQARKTEQRQEQRENLSCVSCSRLYLVSFSDFRPLFFLSPYNSFSLRWIPACFPLCRHIWTLAIIRQVHVCVWMVSGPLNKTRSVLYLLNNFSGRCGSWERTLLLGYVKRRRSPLARSTGWLLTHAFNTPHNEQISEMQERHSNPTMWAGNACVWVCVCRRPMHVCVCVCVCVIMRVVLGNVHSIVAEQTQRRI